MNREESSFELRIEKIVSGGDGFARAEGMAVFVPGALPGEKVRVRVQKKKKDFLRCELLEVLLPSPHRRRPRCSSFGSCGGCDLQHASPELQLQIKEGIFRDALRRLAKLKEFPEIQSFSGSEWEYRSRARLHGIPRGHKFRYGFREKASRRVVFPEDCPVLSLPLEVARKKGFSVKKKDLFLLSPDGESCVVGAGRKNRVRISVLSHEFEVDPSGFFQSNRELLPELVQWVVKDVGGKCAADLYAGAGLFSSFLADSFEEVVMVEQKFSGTPLGVSTRKIRREEQSVADWIRSGGWSKYGEEFVLADPPRTGLCPELRQALTENPPKSFTYVSCNQDTFARDCGEILKGALCLQELALFDFYPQTHHMEVVGRFSRES